MTDAEIIKALECHANPDLASCEECPLLNIQDCCYLLSKEADDLINRQKAELENQSENFKKLVAEHRKLQTDYSSMQSTLAKMSMGVEEAKTEAIKEFAEKVKASRDVLFNNIYSGFHFNVIIDSLVYEMVGDTEC